MANYNLVTNSTFQPFTYNELMAPIQEIEKQYAALESGFDALYSQALPVGSVLTDKDNVQKQQYENYIKNVNSLSEELATKGYSNELARKLVKAKNDYITTIVPIETALKTRAAQIEKQAVGREADHTVEYSYDAANTSLDDFIKNPNLRYSSYSGDKIAKLGEELATHYMNDLRGTSYSDIAELPTMLLVADTYGYTPHEMVAKLKSNPNDPIVSAAVNKALKMSGISNWEGVLDDEGNYTELGERLKENVLSNLYRGAARNSDRQIKTSRVTKPKVTDGDGNGNGNDKPEQEELLYSISPRNLPTTVNDEYNSLASTYRNVINPETGKIKDEYGDVETSIKAYEALQKLDESTKKQDNLTYGDPVWVGDTYVTPVVSTEADKLQQNREKIKNEYNISNILTEDEYKTLKKYTDSNKSVESLIKDLHNSAKRYTAYSVNMAGYDYANNKILTNMSRYKDYLAEYVTDLNGDPIKEKDMPDLSKAKIKDIEYSVAYPGKLLVNIDGKDYVMDPSMINETAQGVVNLLEYNYNLASSDSAKLNVIDTYLGMLLKVLNSGNPEASTTSSKVGIMAN